MPYVAIIDGQYHMVNEDHPQAQSVTNTTLQALSNQGTLVGSGSSLKKSLSKGPDVFIRRPKERKPGLNIGALLRKKTVTGDIGIEIEVEGNKFPKENPHSTLSSPIKTKLIPDMWGYHHDGSLRGYDNAEYVLKKPIKFSEVPGAINALWDMFAKYGSKLDDSNRTSVHIHLNAQKWHLNRVTAFASLYFSVEEILTAWCGDNRVGNLFCLRAKDAPGIISKLKEFIVNNGEYPLSEGLHYGGLNVHALCKFGSLEIRALRGCTDSQTILDWVAILERLYKLSGEYTDPRGVCEGFSGEGPMSYLSNILGDKTQVVKDGIQWDSQKIMESLYEGIRLAQDLCYCREWSEYEPVEVTPDPFDRDPKKVAESLAQMVHEQFEQEYAQAMAPSPATTSLLNGIWGTLPTVPSPHIGGTTIQNVSSPYPPYAGTVPTPEAEEPDGWFDMPDFEDDDD